MPRNSIDTRCRCALALSQRYPKSTSAIQRPRLNPDCDGDKYSSTFGAIIDRTTRDSVRKTIGRTLVRGPFGLPGFWISMSTPLPRPSGSWCSSASLNMLSIGCASKSNEHLNNSDGMSSCPLARPLFSLPIAWFISAGVIR